jgi:DNA-binding MarR family transcriptional regulator
MRSTTPGELTPFTSSASKEVNAVRLWLRMLSCTMLIERRLAGLLRSRFGTTLARFDLLAQLDHARRTESSGLTMSELSRRLMVSNGNVTGLVSRLVREGLIRRRTSATDRRAQIVCLTPKGERALASMIPDHHAWLAEMVDGLDAQDRDRLFDLIGRLKTSVERATSGGGV